MRMIRRLLLAALLPAAVLLAAAAGDLVILKGGVRIDLRKPPARQGNLVLLTRADGTLLSIPASEIDWKATAAAKAPAPAAAPAPAVTAPPETPAQAAKATGHGPKARVKLTDADVSHPSDEGTETGENEKKETLSGPARLEVVDHAQEKAGANLLVRGSMRNSGGAPAVSARMTVTAMDEKGERIASGEAGLSNALIEPGATVTFSVTIPVGERPVGSIRFTPQWLTTPAPAAPTPAPAPTAAPAGAAPASQKPSPAPTPYGLGTLYAPPAAPASTTPPTDDRRGYIPGMSSPENQPKPPK